MLGAYSDTKKGLLPVTNLGDAVRIVADLGGYLGRKKDPPPGHQIMWEGHTVLQHMCLGFILIDSG
jgi:hypothetical protein